MEVISAMLADPEIVDLILEAVFSLLLFAGVPAAYIGTAKRYLNKVVPMLVTQLIVAKIQRHSIDGPKVITLVAKEILSTVRYDIRSRLPKGLVNAPLVTNLVNKATTQALRNVAKGKSPIPVSVAKKGSLAVTAAMNKVGAKAVATLSDSVSLGAGAEYNWKKNTVDWGARLNVEF